MLGSFLRGFPKRAKCWGAALLAALPLSARADWPASALQLTGQSDATYERARQSLRALPDLVELMRAELARPVLAPGEGLPRTRYFLALDVVASLKLTSLVPELEALVGRDPSGYAIHALNRLIVTENRARVMELYRRRLADPQAPLAVQLALLDTLSRHREPLASAELARFASSANASLREAAIAFARRVPPVSMEWVRELCARRVVEEALLAQIRAWLRELPPPRRDLCGSAGGAS